MKFQNRLELVTAIIQNGGTLYSKRANVSLYNDCTFKVEYAASETTIGYYEEDWQTEKPIKKYTYGEFWDNESDPQRVLGLVIRNHTNHIYPFAISDEIGKKHVEFERFREIKDVPEWAEKLQEKFNNL